MKNEAEVAAELRALGGHLVTEQQAVMRAWRQSVKSDPELKTARTLSRSRFDDYIPALLRAFARELAAWPGPGIVAAEGEQGKREAEHGAHRWQEGFALPEVAREWVHLHLTLLDTFEQYAAAAGVGAATMALARRLLVLLCGDGVSRSVTEYTRLMQAEATGRVRDLEAALAQLNGLQRQRADVWREAAHDLRNTVGVVSNATGILRRDDAPDRVRAKSLAALQTGVSSLRTMLNELLSLARLEAGLDQRAVAAFDTGALLSDLCARAQPLAAMRGLFLRTDGPASFFVQGDQEKVGRIAENLVSNALRYTLQGGVTVRWVASDDGDARRWVLSVADTGTRGHSTAAAPVIDELNQIADGKSGHEGGATAAGAPQNDAPPDPDGHGEGIGLSIVKHLCELLDATLEFSANAEGGSTFRIVFPCHYEQQ